MQIDCKFLLFKQYCDEHLCRKIFLHIHDCIGLGSAEKPDQHKINVCIYCKEFAQVLMEAEKSKTCR